MRYIPSTAVGPRHLHGVRLETGRHYVQDRPYPMIAARFRRIVVHPKAETGDSENIAFN